MPVSHDTDSAEALALQVLAHLAGDEDALDRFMALTGMDLEHLKSHAADRAVLVAVLEYYLNHEPSLLAMAEATGLDPALPAQAHRALTGQAGRMMD